MRQQGQRDTNWFDAAARTPVASVTAKKWRAGLLILRVLNPKSVQEVSKQAFRFEVGFPICEGAGSRIRTDDLLITNQLLYQLSYAGQNARAN